jgi:hypothetical protein
MVKMLLFTNLDYDICVLSYAYLLNIKSFFNFQMHIKAHFTLGIKLNNVKY